MSAADPTANFFQQLQASRLLSDGQLRDLWGWVTAARPDVPAAAREVNRRGWLSAFQLREIAKGRGAALTVAGRYVLLDVLGEGGMGRVYKAHDTRMGRDVALKVIRKEKLAHAATVGRFEQEVRALSAMDHPNVVKVYDAEAVGGHHFYVMELIDGADLTKLVRERGPLPVPLACDAIRQAALGLQHAHERGLVHRDIKPSNVIVPRAPGGAVKLVDLGLARLMDQPGGEDARRLTQEGFVIGTPDFLAPEQARNPMAVDIRADVYSLGCTLYFVLTGATPFEGVTPTEKLLRHCTDPPPDLLARRPDAPPHLAQIVTWCLAKAPEERPQTPGQLAAALLPFCPPPPAGAAPLAGPASGPYPLLPARVPPTDPAPSSQVFKLPPRANADDPIRKRAQGAFPVGAAVVALGAVFVVAVLGFAVYRAFRTPDLGDVEPFTNTADMRMVKLPGGTFRMGSPEDEPGRAADGREGPARDVTVTGPLLVSATEVSHGQYLRVMGKSPAKAPSVAARGQSLPVESVTWDEANAFCRALTEAERGRPWARKNWAYRLPTEAEWEYACRAGATTPFAFGEALAFPAQGAYRVTGDDPLERADDAAKPLRFALEVGKTRANDFGLFDMHGNVAEWCADWYKPEAYKDAPSADPPGPADGDKRVVRGGSFREPASAARSAARDGRRPAERFDDVGFRVVYAPVKK